MATVNFYDELSKTATVTANGEVFATGTATSVWSYVGPGSTGAAPLPPNPPAAYNDDVTVDPTVANGTYTYRYTVILGAKTSTADLDLVVADQLEPSNDNCADAINLAFPYTGGGSATVDNQTLGEDCPGQLSPTNSGVAIPSKWGSATYSKDLWYKFYWDASYPAPLPSTVTVTVDGKPYGPDGVNQPVIAVYDSCGGTLVDAEVGIYSKKQADIILSGMFTSSFTYYIRVSAAEGNEGKFDISLTV